MKMKTTTVNGLLMRKQDIVPKEQKIKIRIVSDENNGGTLSLSDADESIALAVSLDDIQKLLKELN